MTPPIIDRAVFKELQDTAGADFVQELVGTFLEEAPLMLQELQDALMAQSADRFRRAAHSLKTNALTFGAMALGEHAKALEQGGLPADASMLQGVQAAYAEAAAALRDLSRG